MRILRVTRLVSPSCVLMAAACFVAIPAGIATAQSAPSPAPAKPAATPQAPRKVWTTADLDKLRTTPSQSVTFLEGQPNQGPEPKLVEGVVAPGPQGVPARLQEMVSEAQANLDRLERERLAAGNPLLRGLAAGQPIRPIADIDKDRLKWAERLRLAETALENAKP